MYPKTEDPLVAALQQLLTREGGHVVVGDAAGISDQSLYQIAFLKPDSKTGRPKGVGPSIRKRLTDRYPDWLSAFGSVAGSASKVTSVGVAELRMTSELPTLEQALPVVLDSLASVSEANRGELLDRLGMWVRYRGEADRARLSELLSLPASTAQRPLGAPIAQEHLQALESLSEEAERQHAASQRRRTSRS